MLLGTFREGLEREVDPAVDRYVTMPHVRTQSVPLLLGLMASLVAGPVLAQALSPEASPSEEERVQLIISKPPAAKDKESRSRLSQLGERLRDAIKKHSGGTTGNALSLTKAEVWSVPKSKVEALKKVAAQHGAIVTEVGPDSHHIFHAPPGDVRMSEKEKAIMEHAKASKSTMGVKLVMGPAPEMLEHVLTGDVKDGLPKIAVTLSDGTVLTINRTSIDIKPDRAIWRGTVEGTGALVTLMWWPSGKMAGTIRHEGHIHAIRHIKDQIYAIVDMSEEKMPQEHAAMPERMRVNDPNLRDESLVKHGDASILRGMTAGSSSSQGQPNSKQQLAFLPPSKPTTAKDKAERPTAKGGSPSKDIVIDLIVAYTPRRQVTTPISGMSSSTLPSRRATNRSARAIWATSSSDSCTPTRPTMWRKARTSITFGTFTTRTATWMRSMACATNTAPMSLFLLSTIPTGVGSRRACLRPRMKRSQSCITSVQRRPTRWCTRLDT